MADIRLLEHRRKWNKRVDHIGLSRSAGGNTEVSEAIGAFAPGVRCLILKAHLVFGADIAIEATGSVSKTTFKLYDRKAAGTGIINVSDGVCVISTGTLTSATAAFTTNEVNAGDQITLSGGTPTTNAGVYRVVSVDSATQLTLDTTFSVASTAEDVDLTGQVGATVENTAALADDIKHDCGADGYVLAENSVIIVERGETDFSTSAAAAVTGPMLIVEWIPLPAV